MKTYESSTATLRAILSHPSLDRASIDKTMDALAEANADAKELDDAVRMGGDMAVGVDSLVDADMEEELEAELRAMAEEAEKEKEAVDMKKRLNEAYVPPTGVTEPVAQVDDKNAQTKVPEVSS